MSSMSPSELNSFPQPDSNESDSVEAALFALRNAHDGSSASEAYDSFLWAIGNNHAGTFYPVVLGVLPEIEQILVSGSPWAQRSAMECLIDLGGSFVPEEGYEMYRGVSVQESLNAFIHSMRCHVTPLVVGNDVQAQSAIDLLELIDDQVK